MAVARIRQWLTKEIEYKSGIACNMLNEIYRQPLRVLPYLASFLQKKAGTDESLYFEGIIVKPHPQTVTH